MGMFGGKEKESAPPPSHDELIRRHRQLAEDHLARAAKGGRLEAETRHAVMAGAHATLALSYQLERSERKEDRDVVA